MRIFSRITRRFSTHPQNEVIEHPHIRDFIYLDIERIRSYISQVYGGLTVERTSKLEHGNTVQGSMTATLPLAFNAKADLSKYLLKSDAETKSLHDQIFDQFYQALLLTKSLRHITDSSSDTWDKTIFNDGTFLSVKAVMTITDYKYVSNFAKRFQEITSMLARTTSASSNMQQKKQAIANQKEIEKIPTKDIAGIVDEFYGDVVRIDFFPFREDTEKIFVGSAERDLFRRSLKDLLTCYGPTIDAGWNAVLQVNRGEYPKNKILAGHTGNAMDIAIKQVVSAISEVLQTAQAIDFPAVSVTPIAIFRETSLG